MSGQILHKHSGGSTALLRQQSARLYINNGASPSRAAQTANSQSPSMTPTSASGVALQIPPELCTDRQPALGSTDGQAQAKMSRYARAGGNVAQKIENRAQKSKQVRSGARGPPDYIAIFNERKVKDTGGGQARKRAGLKADLRTHKQDVNREDLDFRALAQLDPKEAERARQVPDAPEQQPMSELEKKIQKQLE